MNLSSLGFAVVLSGAAMGQGEWPEFRGPTGQGIGGKAPKEWGQEKGVAWKIEVEARGWSSPVVSQGLVILTGALKGDDKTELVVTAFDFKSGDPVWSNRVFEPTEEELSAKHAKNGLASSTPVIRDGVVYAHFGHMGTAALGLKSGEVLWETKVKYNPMHGGGSSPIVVDDLLIFSADGEEDPKLVALQTSTGKVAWETPRNEEVKRSFSFATPLLVDDGGRKVLVSPASGMVGGYDPVDGKLIWKVAYDEGFSVVPRPVEMDGTLYMSTGFMKPVMLAIKLTGATGDVTDSHVAWTAKKGSPKTPSFVAADGVLYVLDDTGSVTCFDGKTGDIKWKNKLMGNFSSSPTLVDGALYCQTEDGVCYVMSVSPEKGTVDFEIDLEERVFASPAIVDGALLMRTETHLWKIGG
ncbi:MAG: PQQ-binding-like beta-propeller repeat protein [Akkermansiaceae bacterium]|nr:PQQ-binding-like beta-propeller repeat protein [Akkermansiaceae bacterium]